jgi:hypothetical protein
MLTCKGKHLDYQMQTPFHVTSQSLCRFQCHGQPPGQQRGRQNHEAAADAATAGLPYLQSGLLQVSVSGRTLPSSATEESTVPAQ